MKTQFLGQAYQSRSPIMASQTAINIYPETTEGNSDSIAGFIGTPGLTSKYQGSGEVRGLWVAGGYLFAVIGGTVYRFDTAYNATNLGALPNISGPVSMTDNGIQIAIAHSSGWHAAAFTDSAIAAVSSSPSGSIITNQDEYVIFTTSIAEEFGLTALADLTSINPLDVASAEGKPDDLVSTISDHREVWLFGTETTEIWSNTGAAFFPFERTPGGFIEQGCAAKFSPAKIDNSVFWLSHDRNGQGIVYRANAYIPQRISTHAIESAINSYSRIDDAIGFCYQEEGHSFYWLIFPTGDESWVYDISTGGWHQRAWLDTTTGLLHRHRANCYAFFNGDHLVGDFANGNIYKMDLQTYTDNGGEIYRERAWEIPDNEYKRTRIDRLEVVGLSGDGASPTDGSAPKVWLQVSKDGGRVFGYQRVINLGAIGKNLYRAIWRRLGLGRNWVLRIATTMANRVQWTGANMVGEGLDQ